MAIDTHRGQALMELALGLFALLLLVTALTAFAAYIVRSLKMQNSLRVKSSSQHDAVEVSPFAVDNLFGTQRLEIRERVVMPMTTISK